jgi:hypothetical protein
VWLRAAGRVKDSEINKLAVARVIASYLWDTGERSEHDRNLPHRLKDRVGRALAGEVLTPTTLDWFIGALRFTDEDAALLWSLLYGPATADSELDDGWYLKSLVTDLYMDDGRPRAVERRVIVATRDGVGEITTSVSVPRVRDDSGREHSLAVEAVSGGVITSREHPHQSHFRQVLQLPSPLRRGELHEYVLQRTLPADQPMAPHYVLVPHRRSDHFGLTVSFDHQRPPAMVWRLSGVPTSVIYDREPTADLVTGVAGTYRASFRAMTQGLAYGLCWSERADGG